MNIRFQRTFFKSENVHVHHVMEFRSTSEKLEIFVEEFITSSLAQIDCDSLGIPAYNQSDQTDLESDFWINYCELVGDMYLFDVDLFCTKYDECFMPSFCRVAV